MHGKMSGGTEKLFKNYNCGANQKLKTKEPLMLKNI